jgi:hypothetical protein
VNLLSAGLRKVTVVIAAEHWGRFAVKINYT